MAQNQSTPVLPITSSSKELLQAETDLWCYAFGYLKSVALQCAIELGIPNAIHRHGGVASLSALHAAVPVAESKRECMSRIMTFLAASGIFREETSDDGDTLYRLTSASRLLVDDDADGGGYKCLTNLMLLMLYYFPSSQRLTEWLQGEEGATTAETPFAMTHGVPLYSYLPHDAQFSSCFNDALGSDSRFLAEILVRECGEVFGKEVTSLVDVGGGDGTTARAIAKAFPHVSCSVLELPHVVAAMPPDDGTVQFVAGNMMEFIPPADVVLLKVVLHNWDDETCVRILKRAKEAISTREPKGKVIIIDVVIGSPSKQTLEAQLLFDLCMMVATKGKQRSKENWHRIFLDAGFTQYKISPTFGSRSLIEVYP